MPIELDFDNHDRRNRAIRIATVIVAGWTGRDRAAVEHHIAELAELGVTPPSEAPLYYRVSPALLTRAPVIEVVGDASSGEVEPVLIDDGQALFLGLGSDHTDRALEAHSVAMSKQACAKPVAATLWRYDKIEDHLDQIELRAWIRDDAETEWTLYQDGTLARIRPLPELIERSPVAAEGERLRPGSAMMCGTFNALGGVRPSRHFRMRMHDPVLGRTIEHGYETVVLPVVA